MNSSSGHRKSGSADQEDYYFENGFMVFTAKYHLKRGFCCGNACRHCPYDHVNVRGKKEKK